MEGNRHKIESVPEAERLEIFSLVDNSIDLLSVVDKKEVYSFRQWTRLLYGNSWIKAHAKLPIAEHGFSVLIRIIKKGKSKSVLFDTVAAPPEF